MATTKELKKKSGANAELSTEELLRLESEYCSWGDTVHYAEKPQIFERCEGAFLYDNEDRPYLDLQMWYSAANFGYNNKRLAGALKKQIDALPQLACQYLHKEKIELAAKISQANEERFQEKGRVHFNVGGSQAVEDSLKLVRNATHRNLVFAFQGGYHGRTLGATSITSSYRYRRRFGHFSDRAQFVPYPYCFRCPYQKKYSDCGMYCVKQFEKQFETEYNGVWDPKAKESEFAAFYVECVQGTGGYVVPPKEYFPELKKVLDRHNVLLVDDEIQMGFYRTGKLWGIENFGVTPDIIVFGKAMTNGLNPLSGMWAKEKLINPKVWPAGMTHSTFSSNSLGTAVALEVMKMTEEENYGKKVTEKGKYFLDAIKGLQKKYKGYIGDVGGLGMALRIEVCEKDGYTPSREITDRMFQLGMEGNIQVGKKKYGLILDVGGYYKNVFTLAPSFDITKEEIALAIELLDQLFQKAIS
ncbi:MAG: aminotransferase class III-fold pyridoxal phosphate-dependent enzyme [Candidatus Omnitrophica bacterium]|nr:aminotransferase class III-fold pyridoxal phosphate-dependent enzyme [Candidatus Omnitrophota bacterium]